MIEIEIIQQGGGFSGFVGILCLSYGMDKNQARFWIAGVNDLAKALKREIKISYCNEWFTE